MLCRVNLKKTAYIKILFLLILLFTVNRVKCRYFVQRVKIALINWAISLPHKTIFHFIVLFQDTSCGERACTAFPYNSEAKHPGKCVQSIH